MYSPTAYATRVANSETPWSARIKVVTNQVEEYGERFLSARFRRRAFATLGPLLVVSTFLEDALRILFRWGEQQRYLSRSVGIPWFLAYIFMLMSMLVQVGGTAGVLGPDAPGQPSRVKPACKVLLGFMAVQPFLYAQATDFGFMCRTVTVAGGLLLLMWGEDEKGRRSEMSTGGLQSGERGATSDRMQLVGRSLLTLLSFFQSLLGEHGGMHTIFYGKPAPSELLATLTLFILSCFVIAGFRTEWSAIGLTAMLAISSIYMYPFWWAPKGYADFYRYYFFQNISVIGGLMLLALHGPGAISVEGTKKGL